MQSVKVKALFPCTEIKKNYERGTASPHTTTPKTPPPRGIDPFPTFQNVDTPKVLCIQIWRER